MLKLVKSELRSLIARGQIGCDPCMAVAFPDGVQDLDIIRRSKPTQCRFWMT